jgi:membrane-associated phospholipid phosphatase
MKVQDSMASDSGFAVRRFMRGRGVQLFERLQKQLSAVLLLSTLGCLPAYGQDTGDRATFDVGKAPSSHLNRDVCILPTARLCSGPSAAEPRSAQSRSSVGATKKTLKRFGKDQAGIYSAPFHRSNLKWDAVFLAGTGLLLATDRRASGTLPGINVNISRNISNVGLYGTSAAVGVLWLSGLATHNEHARETGALSAEAIANAVPVYVGLQFLTGRERPFEASGNGRFWRNNALNSSFPSGHALFTWSMASVIAHEYPRTWVKWLAYGTATAVSVSRFSGREHFPSDIAVGSALGFLIGRHIFQAHCRAGLSDGCHPRKTVVGDQP